MAFFSTQKIDCKRDYQKVINAVNYINWFETKLLPNLQEASIIIVDSARYQKTKPIATLNSWKLR